jgi:Ring finger domain
LKIESNRKKKKKKLKMKKQRLSLLSLDDNKSNVEKDWPRLRKVKERVVSEKENVDGRNDTVDNANCAVCLDQVNASKDSATLPNCCSHVFCFTCIVKWSEMGANTCPLCKSRFARIEGTLNGEKQSIRVRRNDLRVAADGNDVFAQHYDDIDDGDLSDFIVSDDCVSYSSGHESDSSDELDDSFEQQVRERTKRRRLYHSSSSSSDCDDYDDDCDYEQLGTPTVIALRRGYVHVSPTPTPPSSTPPSTSTLSRSRVLLSPRSVIRRDANVALSPLSGVDDIEESDVEDGLDDFWSIQPPLSSHRHFSVVPVETTSLTRPRQRVSAQRRIFDLASDRNPPAANAALPTTTQWLQRGVVDTNRRVPTHRRRRRRRQPLSLAD